MLWLLCVWEVPAWSIHTPSPGFSLASFAAGIVFATVNKRAVLGVIVGLVGGIYIQQVCGGVLWERL